MKFRMGDQKDELSGSNNDNQEVISAHKEKAVSLKLGRTAGLWRRVRDLNPGYTCAYTGFRDQLLKPLGQLSIKKSSKPTQ